VVLVMYSEDARWDKPLSQQTIVNTPGHANLLGENPQTNSAHICSPLNCYLCTWTTPFEIRHSGSLNQEGEQRFANLEGIAVALDSRPSKRIGSAPARQFLHHRSS
jgi:hypothetical protein